MRLAAAVGALAGLSVVVAGIGAAGAGAAAAAHSPAPAKVSTRAPAPVSTGHSQWAWGYETPQGQGLAAVAFDGPTGYAVGNFGTVLRSDDAGATWTGLASGTLDGLDLIQELSPTTVVVGDDCTVEESTDSGRTFRRLPLGLPSSCKDHVAAVAFATASQGYVATHHGTLLYTGDAGVTVQARSSVPVGRGRLTGLAFSSPTTGLAVTSRGRIERTTDGGNSWNQVQVAPTGLQGLTIVSPTLAFAVGGKGDLERSTDGGATWTRMPLALTGGGREPELYRITCADADDCLMVTGNDNRLMRTTDGGMTGTIVSVANQGVWAVAYTTGTRVVGVGDGGRTVISDDAGRTFPSATSGGGLSRFNSGPDVGSPGPLTAGRAAGTAYLPGWHGIAATTDAGRRWSLLRIPTRRRITSVAFVSRRTGYALDTGGVLRRTTDGGASWSSFAEGHSRKSALVAPAARTPLLVGPRGIFRSTDGGADFRKVPGRVRVGHGRGRPVASLRLNSALAVHGGVVAFNSGGASAAKPLVVSTDAGRTWRSVPLPPQLVGGFTSVSAVSPSRLWLLQNDVVYATSDGGRHWHTLPAIGSMQDLNMVSFSSPRDGIVGLEAGHSYDSDESPDPLKEVAVLRTIDGGRTWTPEVIAQHDDVYDDVLATASGDLAVTPADSLPSPVWYFTTAGTRAPARSTALGIRFARPRISREALARAGHSVLVTGRVHPVPAADERVAVSHRANAGWWYETSVRVASNGVFRLRIGHVRTRVEVVAQAVGTSAIAGAGTPVKTLTVTR